MNRYRNHSEGANDPLTPEVDSGFVGVNTKLDPGMLRTSYLYRDVNEQALAPGLLSYAQNLRLESGAAATRRGSATHGNFNPAGMAGQTIYGEGIFSDPNGQEWLLVAVADRVYQLADQRFPKEVSLPAGVTLEEEVFLVQAFDTVLLFRGEALAPLEWDGTVGGEFEVVNQTDPGDGTEAIPSASRAVVMANRLFIQQGRDGIIFSDVLDYTRYLPLANEWRLNDGSDDSIVALLPWRRNNLLVFKDQSVHVISGVSGDLSGAQAEIVSRSLGCVAANTAVNVGGDVYFLASDGVYAVSEVLENSVQGAPVALSDPMEAVMRRVNWVRADRCSAMVLGKYYRLAVPLDGALEPNAVLVYDLETRQWQGVDVFPAEDRVQRLLATDYYGQRRAFAIDRTNGRVVTLDWGRSDVRGSSESEIACLARTRGYTLGTQEDKLFRSLLVSMSTWRPSYTVKFLTDGVAEVVTLVSDKTRDRTRYLAHGKGLWQVNNANDDYGAPGREDYHLLAAEAGFEAHEGVVAFLPQETTEGFALRAVGRWVAIEVSSQQGHVGLRAVSVDGRPRRNQRRIAG
ncbi:MAG: hypothetical protein AAF555_05645 [Verrucomicrobiota bacterium]